MIVGLRFNKILVEKNSSKEKAKISKIHTKTDITNIEEEKLDMKDKKAIRFNFVFNTIYDPELAKISLEGSLLFLEDAKQIDKILEAWKSKKIPPEIRVGVLNAILHKCNLKALSLEPDLDLPPHFPLPKFELKKDNSNEAKTDYAG